MKSNRGVTIAALLVYIAAITIAIGTLAAIASTFYKNVDTTQSTTVSAYSYLKFTKYIVKEINTENNEVVFPTESGVKSNYVIFSLSNNQYEFNSSEGTIYCNKVKICSGIRTCEFSMEDDKLVVEIVTKDGVSYKNKFHLVKI